MANHVEGLLAECAGGWMLAGSQSGDPSLVRLHSAATACRGADPRHGQGAER
jgi:hypothetical protein